MKSIYYYFFFSFTCLLEKNQITITPHIFTLYDVTHSRLVTHFRSLKIQKINTLFFLLLHKLGLLYTFNLKYVFYC